MEKLLKKHAEKLKFAIVGGANTALDFAILFILTSFFGVDKFVANYFSTGLSLIFSFFANKSFTFNDKSKNSRRQFAYFLGITLIGLWVIQPIIIKLSDLAFSPIITDATLSLLIGKLLATVASLIWNYVLYSRIVFKK